METQIIDPSSLTTAQLLREISSLKELLTARINAVEKGIEVAHADLVRVPTEVQKQISALKELTETKIQLNEQLTKEKFQNIDRLFAMVEQSRIEQKKDTATAVDAALKAAKEAVSEQNASNVLAISKSEASIAKQMEYVTKSVTDLKEVVTRIEGVTAGVSTTRQTQTATSNWVIGLFIMAAIAAIGVIVNYLK
jgi:hypothetical protein